MTWYVRVKKNLTRIMDWPHPGVISQDKSGVILISVQLSNISAYPHSLWLETGWLHMICGHKTSPSKASIIVVMLGMDKENGSQWVNMVGKPLSFLTCWNKKVGKISMLRSTFVLPTTYHLVQFICPFDFSIWSNSNFP